MMSSEDIKRLNLVEKLEAEVESLKAQLKEKEDNYEHEEKGNHYRCHGPRRLLSRRISA